MLKTLNFLKKISGRCMQRFNISILTTVVYVYAKEFLAIKFLVVSNRRFVSICIELVRRLIIKHCQRNILRYTLSDLTLSLVL